MTGLFCLLSAKLGLGFNSEGLCSVSSERLKEMEVPIGSN